MDDAEFKRLWLEDVPAREIAQQAGIAIETVSRRAKRMGLTSRKGRPRRWVIRQRRNQLEAVAIANLLALDREARMRVIKYVLKQTEEK